MVLKIPRQQPGAAPPNTYALFHVPIITGVNFTKEFSEMDDSQCSLLQNYYQEQKGVWKQRSGMAKWNTTVMPTIGGVAPERTMAGIEYITTTGIRKRVVVVKYGAVDRILSADYTTKTFAEVTGATALTHSEEWGMQMWLDSLYICNGVEAVQVTSNGTTRADLVVGGGGVARKGKCLTLWHERLIIAGDSADPSAVYASNVLDPTVFQAANTVYIGKNDGDSITCAATTGVNTNLGAPSGQLFIFKNRYTYVFTGDVFNISATPPATVQMLTNTIGCVGIKAVTHTPIGLIWVSRDGVYTSRENGYPEKIDNDVRGLFSGEVSLFTYPVNVDTLGNRVAVGYSSKLAHTKISYTPTAGAGNTDQIWADMRDVNQVGVQWCGVHKGQRVAWFYEDSQGQQFGGTDNDGYLYELDSGMTDSGTAVNTKFISKNYDAGEGMTEKVWRKYKFKFDIYGDTALNLTFNTNFQNQYSIMGSIGLGGSLWDSVLWNTATWGAHNMLGFLSGNLPVMVGENIYITIEGTSNTTSQHELIALILQYQTKRKYIYGK